eukprot:663695-Rhodomonas_salina.2
MEIMLGTETRNFKANRIPGRFDLSFHSISLCSVWLSQSVAQCLQLVSGSDMLYGSEQVEGPDKVSSSDEISGFGSSASC